MELPREMVDALEHQDNMGGKGAGGALKSKTSGSNVESKPLNDAGNNSSEVKDRRSAADRADADDDDADRRHSRDKSRGRSRSASSSGRRRDRRGSSGRHRSRDRRGSSGRRRRGRSRSRETRRPMTQEEARMRDANCVFVSQLQVKASEDDVEFFFGLFCKVREVALIREKATGRSKGFGYVELETIDDVPKALMLSGLPFVWKDSTKGFPVVVRPSEAHKQYLINQGLAPAPPGSGKTNQATPVPQVNIELLEMIGPSSCKAKVDGGPVQVLPVYRGKPMYSRLLYVGNLHKSLTDNDIRDLFSAFGPIENIQLKLDPLTRQSKGFAFVKFRDFAAAAIANEKMNGYVLMGLNLACNPVQDKHQQQGGTGEGGNNPRDDSWTTLDEGTEAPSSSSASSRGVSLHSQRRVELMSKLAGGAAQDLIMPSATAAGGGGGGGDHLTMGATRKILITNMFDPAEETGTDWDKEIERDTREECEKFGAVVSCEVDRMSREGRCWVMFQNAADAGRAAASLRGRWFGKRQIQVDFV